MTSPPMKRAGEEDDELLARRDLLRRLPAHVRQPAAEDGDEQSDDHLGFGRVVASEIAAPNILMSMV